MADSTWTGAVNNDWSTAGNWSAGIPGAGNIATFPGAATVTLSAGATAMPSITVVAGTVALNFLGGSFSVGAGFSVLNVAGGATLQIAADISGAGGITKQGLGTATLTGSNSFTGVTTVNAGTLVTASNALASTSGLSVSAGATVNAVNINSSAPVTVVGTATFSQANLGIGVTTVAAGGLLTFSAVAGGSSVASLAGPGNVSVQTPVFSIVNGGTTFSGVISGPCALTTPVVGGALTLAGANTYLGGTGISGGTVVAGNASAFGSGTISLSGGTLNLNSVAVTNTLAVSGGSITNGGSYPGAVSVTTGTFTVSTLPSAASFAVSGAAYLDFGGGALTAPVTMGPGGGIINGSMPAANLTLAGSSGLARIEAALTGAGGLIVPGGVVARFDAAPTFTGPVSLGASAQLAFNTAMTLSASSVTMASSSIITASVPAATELAGDIIGDGAIIVGGTGSGLTLSGDNSAYSGAIIVGTLGTLIAGSDTAFGTADVTATTSASASDFNVIDFDGFAIANGVNVTFPATGGYTKLTGGTNYAGTVSLSPLASMQIPPGNNLAGTANVSATADLNIGGAHTGIINNDGTVTIDNGTAAATPLNVYNGSCGSTYAVRAA